MGLHKIAIEDLIFTNDTQDRINVATELKDYDWMYYTFDARFNTKNIGWVSVKFEYVGASSSFMHVKTTTDYYEYQFDSSIFLKYLKQYLSDFVESFDDVQTFYPGSIVLDWFNEIIENGRLSLHLTNKLDIINIKWKWDIPKKTIIKERTQL